MTHQSIFFKIASPIGSSIFIKLLKQDIYSAKNKLCITQSSIYLKAVALPAWSSPRTVANDDLIDFISVLEKDHGQCTFLLVSKVILPFSRSTIIRQLFMRWVSFSLKQKQKNTFSTGTVCHLLQYAASVSWWLSSGRWNVRAWHFA